MKLKEYVDDTGITLAKLAKRARVSYSTIKNAFLQKNLTLENAYRIHLATKKKCTLPELLSEEVTEAINRDFVDQVAGENNS